MQRVLRFLLVWFLVVAMPLKGVAAVAMLACGPAHAHGHSAVQAPADHADHAAGHGFADHAGTTHHHAAHAAPAQGGDDGADALSKLIHKCSACAACGAGAALPAQPPHFAAPEAEPTAFTPLPLSAVRFVTDGPDRPPRPFLA